MVLDSLLASSLFEDFFQPKLCRLLLASASKRRSLLPIVHAFVDKSVDCHIAAARSLKEALGDSSAFVDCLCVLATIEPEFDEKLLVRRLFETLN